MKKTVDFIDLCRYDKELKYAIDIKVLSDEFILGNKGDQLRFAVSEYGFNRLMIDYKDDLIDIKGSTLMVDGFNYPDITTEAMIRGVDEHLSEVKAQIKAEFPKLEIFDE